MGLGPGHIVLAGDPAMLPKRGQNPSPIFGPFLLWPNSWMQEDATWYGGRRLCVTWGPSSSLPKKRGLSPQFSAHVYCGQTAAWTKMPLGVEVGLGPGDFVFHGDPATPRKKAHPPHPTFGPCLLWPNGWTDQDATWCGGRPRPRQHCVR